MSDSDRLEKKIARLSDEIAVTGSGHRVLAAADPEALVRLLLREVSETVLQRCLVVETVAHACARIEVAAGRVLALETADGVVSGAGEFTDVTDFAVAMAAALRRFLGEETQLLIWTEAAATKAQPTDLRCSAERIATFLGPQSDGGDGLSAFARALADHALAWRISDPGGRSGDSGGPADRVATLDAWLVKAGDGLERQFDLALGGAGRPGCLLLAAEAGGGDRLVIARSGAARLLMLARASVDTDLTERWNALFGG